MGNAKIRRIAPYLGALLLILIAMAIRYVSRIYGSAPSWLWLIRSGIYIGMIAVWGVSLHRRILQNQTRRYLTAIAGLMVLWLALRTVKYSIHNVDAARYLWYLYYLPMLLIPTLSISVAMALGKPEDYRLPGWLRLLYIPTFVLLALVLTNDIHQLVFRFPDGLMSDREYSYGIGYYVVAGWEGLCAAVALGIILYQCRIPHSNVFLWLPMIPFTLVIVYAVCYVRGVYWVWLLAGDVTVSLCLLTAAIFESCIQCRLILSNQGYEMLLALTTVPTQITDKQYRVRYASGAVSPLTKEAMEQSVSSTYALDKHTILTGHSVEQGYVFWQEDITKLVEVTDALQITQSELRDTGDILKAESEQKARWLRITEQNRLYDLIEQQTSHQMQLLDQLLGQLRNTQDIDAAKRILGQIVVIGTYIKRRSNLIFASGQRRTIAAEELRLCLNESMANLQLYGVACQVNWELEGQLPQETGYAVYDLFEAVVEVTCTELSSLLFYAGEQNGLIAVRISVLGSGDDSMLLERFPQLNRETDEDGIRYYSCTLEGGAGG